MGLRLNEIIGPTVQGEGIWTGCPSMFVRVQGCSLRCPNCDTKHSWEFNDEETPLLDIQRRLLEHPTPDLVITGGEPMDPLHQEGVSSLAKWAHDIGRRVTIETSGYWAGAFTFNINLMHWVTLWSISPKLPGLGIKRLALHKSFADWLWSAGHNIQLKFVVTPESWSRDLEGIQSYIEAYEVQPTDKRYRIVVQAATKFDKEGNWNPEQVIDDWARTAMEVLRSNWLLRFHPQILPQAHRLIGVA